MNPCLVDQSTVKSDNALLFPWLSSGLDEKQTMIESRNSFRKKEKLSMFLKAFRKSFLFSYMVCADNYNKQKW